MNPTRQIECPRSADRRALLADAVVLLSVSLLPALRKANAQTAAPAAGPAASAPLLAESDPAAVAVSYVEDANKAKDAQPGANCSNCVQYKDAADGQGDCKLFPGKRVKAAGWCSAWSDL